MSGFGEAGMQGASAGDLIVTVRVKPHENFERDGNHLHAAITVPMVQAALGAELEVDGIMEDETVKVKVPAGTQAGDVVRVKGHGLPKLGSDSRGDLFVHVDVRIPKKLSKRERELLEELASEMGEAVSQKKSPLEKIRDAFELGCARRASHRFSLDEQVLSAERRGARSSSVLPTKTSGTPASCAFRLGEHIAVVDASRRLLECKVEGMGDSLVASVASRLGCPGTLLPYNPLPGPGQGRQDGDRRAPCH